MAPMYVFSFVPVRLSPSLFPNAVSLSLPLSLSLSLPTPFLSTPSPSKLSLEPLSPLSPFLSHHLSLSPSSPPLPFTCPFTHTPFVRTTMYVCPSLYSAVFLSPFHPILSSIRFSISVCLIISLTLSFSFSRCLFPSIICTIYFFFQILHVPTSFYFQTKILQEENRVSISNFADYRLVQ